MTDDAAAVAADLSHRPRLSSLRHLGRSDVPRPEAALLPGIAPAARRRVTPPQQLAGRLGYDKGFLGSFAVDFPEPTGARSRDVTPVEGSADGRLHYQHFSVVMSASRRMALFTAVNIEGARSVSIARDSDPWFLDGRIPIEAQLGEEFYSGNRLDRGHLVRREDPNWGADAALANADTFHFTNCAPQMDVVNQRTWLGLENYILQNARAWRDRCSVFTGPVFGKTDLAYRGALIPAAFWKVVAFLSDDGKPSATAYLVEQDKELGGLEAAFGAYKTTQRSVRHIEAITGVSFGHLAQYDGFSNEEVAMGGLSISAELASPADLRV